MLFASQAGQQAVQLEQQAQPSNHRRPPPGMHALDHLKPPEWRSPPAGVELKGQVNMDTMFGLTLHQLALNPEVRLVLEIGTWYAPAPARPLQIAAWLS